MRVKERHFRLFPSMKAWINPLTNSTYKMGDLLPRLKLANTLEKLANSKDPVKLFYRGEMAETIAREMAEGGEAMAWINPVTNSTYKMGDLLPRLKLANTLEKLANSKDPVKLFYRGEMAETIAREMAEGGGIITKADLASYKPRVYKQLANAHFRGNLVMCGGPPPSSFVVTQLIVSVMSALYPENHKTDILSDPKATHHFIEAMKFAYAQR
ncbi:hypothetical protein COOONC_13796 [Cooperia oncophora]